MGSRDEMPSGSMFSCQDPVGVVPHLPACICTAACTLFGLMLVLLVMQVRGIWYDYWSQCDSSFGAELKAMVEESLKKM